LLLPRARNHDVFGATGRTLAGGATSTAVGSAASPRRSPGPAA
jgi:hypothetical protein